MSTPLPSKICWLDLETTDTDPNAAHAALLEIGAVITDWSPELNVLASASLTVRPAGAQPDHDLMWTRMHPKVQQMHTDNGLWREATTSEDAWTTTEADIGITQWLVRHVGDEPVPLAGSGTGHMDLPWVKSWLPRLSTRLTYWPLDIGMIRRMLELAGRGDHVDMVTDVDAKPHRGLDDVELHIAEARRYLALLGRLPRLEAAPAPPVTTTTV